MADAYDPPFDEDAIQRLRLAAEEVAWLTGRGYPLTTVSDLVAAHHGLGTAHRAALARGTCSEPQYRRRAAREIEAEDVARRPLAIDAIDAVATVEAALAGKPVLATLDGTMRAFDADRSTYRPGPFTDAAVDALLAGVKELRPSTLRFLLPTGSELEPRLVDAAKARKLKCEVIHADDVPKALRKERQIVTGDAGTLDACAGWFNLVGRTIASMPNARVVRLQ